MKKYFFKTVIIIIIITCLIFISISSSSTYLKNNLYRNDKDNISIKSKEMEIFFSAPTVKYNSKYAEINLKETDSVILAPGKPILPKSNIIMKFPLGTKIQNIKVILSEVKQLTLLKSLITAPYPIINSDNLGLMKNNLKPDLLKTSDVYPKKWFDYKTGGGLENEERITFLSIHLYPVKYLPALEKIEYVDKIKIEVEYSTPENPRNYPDVYDLLIIAPSEFYDNLNLLVEHKNNCGVSTKLVKTEEISSPGRDKQEQIKYFIKESIENWDIKYVLLVGTKTKIPVRYTYPMDLLYGKIPTDLYYADIYDSNGSFSSWDSNNNDIFGENTRFYSDEVDLYPDVSLGRLYCKDKSEVIDVVNKIISYEENLNKEWFNNIIICGGNTHYNWKDYFFINDPSYKKYLGDGSPTYEGEYIGNKISEILVNFNSEKFYASSILPNSEYKNKLTKSNINNAINNGAGFVFLIGHGKPSIWFTYPPLVGFITMPFPRGYTTNQIKKLKNENKYPIIIFDACSCGDFKKSNKPIAWEAVKLKSKGAIASFASTALTMGYPGTYCEKGFNNLIDLGIAQAIANGTEKAGDLLKSSINNYLNVVDFDNQFYSSNVYIVQIQELFGDPTLKLG